MTGNLLTNGNGISRIMESATLRRIRFGLYTGDEQAVLMKFVDPAPCEAVCASVQIDGPPAESQTNNRDCIDIITVPSSPKDDPTLRMKWINWAADPARVDCCPALTVKLHGVEVVWRPGRAVVFAQTEQMEPIVAAVVEFAYYHNELRKLECEIADSWQELEIDKRLAYEVRKIDLARHDGVRRRMDDTLQRRIRHVRIEPHLYRPAPNLPPIARKLGEQLRESAKVEDSLETIDGQLEVFEHIYEMSSQRIGEFRAARQEHTLEWVIIILLATETLLLLADFIWNLRG